MARTLSDEDEALVAQVLDFWHGMARRRAWGTMFLRLDPTGDPLELPQYSVLTREDADRLDYILAELDQMWNP